MHDLNDYYYFHAVVTYHGFSAAARKIGVPKATLSKSVARLEKRLGLRLLERSTRQLRTTEVGHTFYERCVTIFAGVEEAEAIAAQAHTQPCGIVRMSAPQGLIQNLLADMLPTFMKEYPKVRVQLKVLNRAVDLIEDGVDIALRARVNVDTNPSLVVRRLGLSELLLVMSPSVRKALGKAPTAERLAELPTLAMVDEPEEHSWELIGPRGETRNIRHQPIFFCSDFEMLRVAALEGLGVAPLPEHIARPYLASGELVRVLPGWHLPYGVIHAVFTGRKGLRPGVRALIDYLVREVPKKVQTPQ